MGRLDKESQGLILMTNQGFLVNRLMRGSSCHEKEYLVWVDKPVTAGFLKRLGAGVPLPELATVTRPCFVEKTGEKSFRIILTQGLNRQIRRMCSRLGYQVKALIRVRIVNIVLGDLEAGEYRHVTDEEYKALLERLSVPAT